jgi:hypothetical protein
MQARKQSNQESLAKREVELVAVQAAYVVAASRLAKELLDLQAHEKRLLERSLDLRSSLEREVRMQLSPALTKLESQVGQQEMETSLYLRLVALEEKRARVRCMELKVASERQELDLKRARLSEKEAVLAYRAAALDSRILSDLGPSEELPIQGAWPPRG